MNPAPEREKTLNTQRFVAFDTETTGLWAASNRIVEIAGVAFDLRSTVFETFQELINPGRPIPPEVIEIHKIVDDMVSGADPAAPVLTRFFEFCGPDSVLIAHNAPFDLSFVAWELSRNNMTIPANAVIDTRLLAQHIRPGMQSYSLLSLVTELELSDRQEHRALGDAILVHKLFEKFISITPEIATLSQLLMAGGNFRLHEAIPIETELPDSFADLSTAIKESATIEIRYAKPGQPVHERSVRPLHVHRLGQNLYLNAFCPNVNEERTFRLDRIVSWRIIRP